MARALLESNAVRTVTGFDRSVPLAQALYNDSVAVHKAPNRMPTNPSEAVTSETDFVVLVLQNEQQCQDVCFDDENNLIQKIPKTCGIIICSTVTALWVQRAALQFKNAGIQHFVDAPMSGGPIRARVGELSIMASATPESLQHSMHVLQLMGTVHTIQGGVGMGSTVKMVHQLLAGVHVVAAAEALALAAAAGLDVQQVYDIVCGAAGASWMFQDRGQRMMMSQSETIIKSQLQIFVKDLDIVYSEAKRLQAPIPLAMTALQQFITGQSLGLSQKDDSTVVQVYENVTGVRVNKCAGATAGASQDMVWRAGNGRVEEIVEVGEEPRHKVILSNEFSRVMRVVFPAGDTTLAHRHDQDSLYFFLMEGRMDFVNHAKGSQPQCDCVDFGEIRYGTHKTDQPLIHKITNASTKPAFVFDAEILKKPPVTAVIPLVAEKHELIKTRDKCRVYKLMLQPGESVSLSYPFFHLTVVVEAAVVRKEISGPISWTETLSRGDVGWKEPLTITKTNVGETMFVEYIAEWC